MLASGRLKEKPLSARRDAMPRSLLIALLSALLIHGFLIFGVHYELPRSGQPGRMAISMTLVRPNPPKRAEVTSETPPSEPVQTPLPSAVAPEPPPEIKAEPKPREKPHVPAKPAARKARAQPATPTDSASPQMVGPPRPESQLGFVGPSKPAPSNAFVGPPTPTPKALAQAQKQLAANQPKARPSAIPNPAGQTSAKTEAPKIPAESSPELPAQANTPAHPDRTEAEPSLPWDDDEEDQADEDESALAATPHPEASAPPIEPTAAAPASPKAIAPTASTAPAKLAGQPPPQTSARVSTPTPPPEAKGNPIPSHSRPLGAPNSPLPQHRQPPVAPPPKPTAPVPVFGKDRTPPKTIEPTQAESPKSEPAPAKSNTLADAEPLITPKTAPTGKSGDSQALKTRKKTVATSPKNGDKTGKPAFSASLLSQQIAEVSADIYRQRSDEMRDKKIVYATEVKTNRLVVAAYEQAWQEKVERIGNLNYPDEARRDKLSGTLMLAVGIKPDGSIYSVQMQQPSGHEALDNAARNIVRLAGPFAPLPKEIRDEVDILVITRTWRFDSNYHLETRDR
ncbi:MAG: TonB family protein [Methylococcaceae bacterium]|nr:TonB family protein [Methylococcaceae bacterium]